MAVESRAQLKGYFEMGDRPTELEFAALIDSFVHKSGDGELLGISFWNADASYVAGQKVFRAVGELFGVFRAVVTTGPGWVSGDWVLVPLSASLAAGAVGWAELNGALLAGDLASGGENQLASAAVIRNFVLDAVSGVASGFSWKLSARAVVGNGEALSGSYTSADGITLVAGDRVVRNASVSPALNGIYVVDSGDWVRAEDADTGDKLRAAAVIVEEGVLFGDSIFFVTSNGEIELGVTSITWARIGSNVFSAGTGIQISGNVIGVNEAAVQMRVVSPGVYVPGTLNMDVVFQTASSSVGTPLNFSVSGMSNGGIGKSVYIRLSSANTGDSFGVSVAGFSIEFAGFGFRGGVVNEVYVSQVTASVLRVTINPVV